MSSSLHSPLLSSRPHIADGDAENPLRGDDLRENHPTERVAGLQDVLLRKNVLLMLTLVMYGITYYLSYWFSNQEDEHIRTGPEQAVHQIAGGGAGLLSCLLVMLSYLRNKRLQRHPNNLIFWRTVADALNATLFLAGGAGRSGEENPENAACRPYSVLREFFFLSSEGWFFAMCLDLWQSSINPFFTFKHMMRWYHVMAWTLGAIFALMLWLTNGYGWTEFGMYKTKFGTHKDTQQFCWVKNVGQILHLNILKALFIYLPVGLLYIVTVALLVASFLRLRHGRLPHTFRTRLHVLVLHSMYVIAFFIHWMVTSLLYWSLHMRDFKSCTNHLCGATFIYVLTSKGVVNLVLWILTHEPELMFGLSPTVELPGDSDEVFEEQDNSYKPQVNQALQAEVVYYLTEGIMTSTRILGEDPRRIAEREIDLNKNDLPPIGWKDIVEEIYCIVFGWNTKKCGHQQEVAPSSSFSGALLQSESAEHREVLAAAKALQGPAKGSELEKTADRGRGGVGPEHEVVGCSTPSPSENGEAAELQTEVGAEVVDRDAEVEARSENSAACAAARGGGHGDADVNLLLRAPHILHSPGSSETGCHQKVKFISYQEEEFQSVRHHCGITEEEYIVAFQSTSKERLSEGGGSGAFFLYSGDERFMVKSCTEKEIIVLRSIAKPYANYIKENNGTYLTRLLGAHCLRLYNTSFFFYIMENLFAPARDGTVINDRYDIKGSWVNRNKTIPTAGKEVVCRHCNQSYIYFKEDVANKHGPYSPRNARKRNDRSMLPANRKCSSEITVSGMHEPNTLRKDNELTFKLRLHPRQAGNVVRQLQADSQFLCAMGIMDYSLLLGVSNKRIMIPHDDQNLLGSPLTWGGEPTWKTASPAVLTYPASPAPPSPDLPDAFRPRSGPRRHGSDAALSEAASPDPHASNDCLRGRHQALCVVAPVYYYMAIIDILQKWDYKKRVERFIKVRIKGKDGDGLSAIDPERYKERFQRAMNNLVATGADTSC